MPALRGGRCECTACGEFFSDVRGFDKHRMGKFGTGVPRSCLTPAEMLAANWDRNPKGFWLVPDARRRALKSAGAEIEQPSVIGHGSWGRVRSQRAGKVQIAQAA
ncbi:hypothetical protein [Pseudoxanthomonas sacheonensis]|uniref:FDXHR family putative zinc-binding protein n=1 Tax=Pseudoxanthomonas sacheonensis TaxID=443615 RepID=UPI003CCCBCCC